MDTPAPISGPRARRPVLALVLLATSRVLRAARQPRAVLELAHVPHAGLLGGSAVRCHVCGSVLRPWQERAVTRDATGRWRCGTVASGHPQGARVPRGRRSLAWLLAASIMPSSVSGPEVR